MRPLNFFDGDKNLNDSPDAGVMSAFVDCVYTSVQPHMWMWICCYKDVLSEAPKAISKLIIGCLVKQMDDYFALVYESAGSSHNMLKTCSSHSHCTKNEKLCGKVAVLRSSLETWAELLEQYVRKRICPVSQSDCIPTLVEYLKKDDSNNVTLAMSPIKVGFPRHL